MYPRDQRTCQPLRAFCFGRAMACAVLAGLLLSGCGINDIPAYNESAKAKWSDVENQYQRRADLIPNLVNTVSGAANFEKSTLAEITEARASVGRVQLPVQPGGILKRGQCLGLSPGGPQRHAQLPQRMGMGRLDGPVARVFQGLARTELRRPLERRDHVGGVLALH